MQVLQAVGADFLADEFRHRRRSAKEPEPEAERGRAGGGREPARAGGGGEPARAGGGGEPARAAAGGPPPEPGGEAGTKGGRVMSERARRNRERKGDGVLARGNRQRPAHGRHERFLVQM